MVDESVTSEIEEDLYEEVDETESTSTYTPEPVPARCPVTSRNFVTFGALPASPVNPLLINPVVRKPTTVIPEPKQKIQGCSMNLENANPELDIVLGTPMNKRGVTFGPLNSSSVQTPARIIHAQKEAERAARRQIQEEA